MQPKSSISPSIRVGLTVLAGILSIYLLITWVKRSHLFAPDENHYTIYFDNVSGLLKGDPVQLRGFPVGRVEEIVPTAKYVKVMVAVDASIPVYEDARAQIQVKELMGGKLISLNPGSKGNMLSGEDIIIIGSASLDFSSSFSEVGDFLNLIEDQGLQTTFGRLDSITRWMYQIAQNIDPEVPGRIFARTDQLTSEMERLSKLSKEIDWQKELNYYRDNLDQTLTRANSLLNTADSLISEVDIQQLYKELEKGSNLLSRADSLISELSVISKSLQDENVLAGRLLYDKNLSRGLDTTLYHLNETLKQIHERKVVVGFGRKKN
ncbi:MAG: MlaD family protein [Bacteroidia bacterium]|nr:MlaD family protein [Bacteroidia bacterium]